MILNKAARDHYVLDVVTTNRVTGAVLAGLGYAASFDRGGTWHPPYRVELLDHGERLWWLLSGPRFVDPGDGAGAVPVLRSVRPLLRTVDFPEVLIDPCPTVTVDGR